MPGLTDKLFDKLFDKEQNINVTVNDELLEWLYDDSEEYQNLIKSQNDSVSRKENLKKLVFKLYKEKKLKDVVFFKYLAWSGQGHLCKLIGYGDKQLKKWMEEKQKLANEAMDTDGSDVGIANKPHIISDTTNKPMEVYKDTVLPMGRGDNTLTTDSPRHPLHHSAEVNPPQHLPERTLPQNSSTKPETHIIYSEKESDDVLELADFLRSCGIPCDIDQYHSHEKILDWGLWNEQKIMDCAKDDEFVLLICSSTMCEQLSKPDKSVRIQMKPGHIDSLSLNSLIKGEATAHCIIPVCLEYLQMENIPKSLTERACYFLSISKLRQYKDPSYILSLPEFESLQRLVFKLKKQPDADKPPVAS